MTPTQELAGFLVDAEVSEDHRAKATDYLLDTIGCILFGAEQPWSHRAADHALRTGGDGGPCAVFGAGFSTTSPMAAFANGASAHAFELDDVHEEAISHPGAVIVPATLAIGNRIGATGCQVLDAIVVGYGMLAFGWALVITAVFIRTRHHRQRMQTLNRETSL